MILFKPFFAQEFVDVEVVVKRFGNHFRGVQDGDPVIVKMSDLFFNEWVMGAPKDESPDVLKASAH